MRCWLADEVLAKLSPVFDAMCAEGGRPSIQPERQLKSMLRRGGSGGRLLKRTGRDRLYLSAL